MKKIFICVCLIAATFHSYSQSQSIIDISPAVGNGIRFWSSDTYKIHMGNTSEYRYGPVNDYSIKSNMSDYNGRGWTWGVDNQTPIAALSNTGILQLHQKMISRGMDIYAGDGNGIRFWGSDDYKIHMGNSSEYHYGSVTDYSLKSNMSDYSGRGWTWGVHGQTPIASLSNTGTLQLHLKMISRGMDIYAGDGNGIRFWGSDNYKIHMGNSSEYHYGSVTDYSLKSNMSDYNGRGWTWGVPSQTPIAALNNTGNFQIAGNLISMGKIETTEVKVSLTPGTGPDYVFESDYPLRTLQETKKYISKNKHLPEIPSAKEMEANGLELGDMNMRLLKKIEELTLYVIEQNEQIKKLQTSNARIDELEKKIELLNKN